MKMHKTISTPEIGHYGNDQNIPMRAYKLPSGAWFDQETNMLHIPTQPNDRMPAIAEALEGHPLQDSLIAGIAEQLETYSIACYMLGSKE